MDPVGLKCLWSTRKQSKTLLLIHQQQHSAGMLSRQQPASPGCGSISVGRLRRPKLLVGGF
jgi:hypothetical protein